MYPTGGKGGGWGLVAKMGAACCAPILQTLLRSRGLSPVTGVEADVFGGKVTGPVAGHGFARVQIYDPLGRSNSVAAVTGEKALQVGKDFLLQYWNLSR